MKNVFVYWIGNEPKLINILRNLMRLYSHQGACYTFHFIERTNLHEYFGIVPTYFWDLIPAYQADFVRVKVICEYGGIWLDSDTIITQPLDSLFNLMESKDGFFIQDNAGDLINSMFGSKPNTALMRTFLDRVTTLFDEKKNDIFWTEAGTHILGELRKSNPELYADYNILIGKDTLYPVNWSDCEEAFLRLKYDNYQEIMRPFQPAIVIVHQVYQAVESMRESEIIGGKKMPLSYFLSSAFEGLQNLRDIEFVEIGTSNFDTLLQSCDDSKQGISIDPVAYYLDQLPNRPNVEKLNVAISDHVGKCSVFFIPEKDIETNNLPWWFKGCNSLGKFHPLHEKYNVTHLCVEEKINILPLQQLLIENKIRSINFLKIDTEGHDTIILKCYHHFLCGVPKAFYPSKIMFESNEWTKEEDVTCIIQMYTDIGYQLIHRGHDTILQL